MLRAGKVDLGPFDEVPSEESTAEITDDNNEVISRPTGVVRRAEFASASRSSFLFRRIRSAVPHLRTYNGSVQNLETPALGIPEKFYTLNEVAKLLSVSRTTVYRWRQRGLGVVRIHGVVRVGELSLRRFLADHYAREEQAVPMPA